MCLKVKFHKSVELTKRVKDSGVLVKKSIFLILAALPAGPRWYATLLRYQGEVVDIESAGGTDVFLSANKVKD